jgi:hypothetical protein
MRTLSLLLAMSMLLVPRAAAQSSEASYSTSWFQITYQTDPGDPDAPPLADEDESGIPDSIERLGGALDAARSFLIDDLGFELPPGEGLYQVYVIKGGDEPHVRIVPAEEGRSRETFIVIPPHQIRDVVPQENLEGLMAHEYFHAIQYGYDYLEQSWFHESTASLMEDLVHPELRQRYWTVPYFLTTLERGLASTDGKREYGAFIFFRAIQQNLGLNDDELVDLVQQTLVATGEDDVDAFEALDSVLSLYGTTLGEMWAHAQIMFRRPAMFPDSDALREVLVGSGWLRTTPPTKVLGETCRRTLLDASSMSALASDFITIRPKDVDPDGTVSVVAPPGSNVSLLRKQDVSEVWPVGPEGSIDLAVSLSGVFKLGVSSGLLEGSVAYSVRPTDSPVLTHASAPSGQARLRYGVSTKLRGHLACGGEPAPFAQLVLIATAADGSATEIPATTDEDGNWSLTVQPDMDSSFSVEVRDPLLSSTVSLAKPVLVEQFVTMSAEREQDRFIQVAGTVTPATPGAIVRLQFRRPEASRWRPGPTASVDDAGAYLMSAEVPADGVWEVRTVLEDDRDPWRQAGTSVLQVLRLPG